VKLEEEALALVAEIAQSPGLGQTHGQLASDNDLAADDAAGPVAAARSDGFASRVKEIHTAGLWPHALPPEKPVQS
jgi:hypothetical protein